MKNLISRRHCIGSLLSGFIFFILLFPSQSTAQHNQIITGHDDLNVDITSRMNVKDADYGMTTKEGSVDMMLANRSIIIQFSDQFLDGLDEEIRGEADLDEENVLAEVITSMVSSGVQTLLNRALEIPIDEIKEIYYDDGKLYIIDKEGEEIFGELEIDDIYVMEDFSRRDALRFVSRAEKRMI